MTVLTALLHLVQRRSYNFTLLNVLVQVCKSSCSVSCTEICLRVTQMTLKLGHLGVIKFWRSVLSEKPIYTVHRQADNIIAMMTH